MEKGTCFQIWEEIFCHVILVLVLNILGSGCNQCPHPTCQFALKKIGVGTCDACEGIGTLCLNILGTFLECNMCTNSILMPKARSRPSLLLSPYVHSANLVEINVLDETDPETGDKLLEFIIANNEAPEILKPLLDASQKTTTIKSGYRSENLIGDCIEALNERYHFFTSF
jgi:hypothetical protein